MFNSIVLYEEKVNTDIHQGAATGIGVVTYAGTGTGTGAGIKIKSHSGIRTGSGKNPVLVRLSYKCRSSGTSTGEKKVVLVF